MSAPDTAGPRPSSFRGPQPPAGRIPPQAVQVEQSVLGAMLMEAEAIPTAIEILPEDAFYSAKHRKIYRCILTLFDKGNPVDLITVSEELKRNDELESIGGSYYLTELTASVASAANVEYHSRIIAEKSLLRKMIETMTSLVGQAYDPSADAFELMDEAEGEIFRISDSQLRKAASSMGDVLKDTLARLESIHGREGGITGVPSGFTRLDQMTGGWQPSDLIIIAARPSMGKTALSLAIARNAALHPEHPTGVAIFSLEMSSQQLAQRLLTSEARVDAQAARTGRLSDDDWPRLARAAGKLSDAKIFIDDTPGLTVLELRAKCRRLKAEHDIGMVVVDYLQLMRGTGLGKQANREQEIAHISRSLKGLAKEMNVPVLALSQLSRAVESRGGDKRPQLSDLRESGCLTGDSLVTLADTGVRVPIRDLAGSNGFRVWALDTDSWKLEKRTVSNAFSTGVKPVHRLETSLGRSIRATQNHKFLTFDGWKRLDQLEAGEHVALPRRIERPAISESKMSNEQLVLVSRGRASKVAATLESRELQQLTESDSERDSERDSESDVYWDRIASIEPDGAEEVFDLTVPGPANFVVNDIVVHNSIEQDADVVAFIYRAERYGITVDENGNSTEGIAEVIVGKQRNGPIGDVTLAFVHQHARFENLTTYYGPAEESATGDGFGGPPGGPSGSSSDDAPF